uniref:Cysteine rich secreted protein n=1 Tax=Riptortus pedestris TaxID=329032 RepID=R4WN69_RIPPE|nr:cysteine rich secreted protein [Riptortus pedestris]
MPRFFIIANILCFLGLSLSSVPVNSQLSAWCSSTTFCSSGYRCCSPTSCCPISTLCCPGGRTCCRRSIDLYGLPALVAKHN